jgi:hypothetical protein
LNVRSARGNLRRVPRGARGKAAPGRVEPEPVIYGVLKRAIRKAFPNTCLLSTGVVCLVRLRRGRMASKTVGKERSSKDSWQVRGVKTKPDFLDRNENVNYDTGAHLSRRGYTGQKFGTVKLRPTLGSNACSARLCPYLARAARSGQRISFSERTLNLQRNAAGGSAASGKRERFRACCKQQVVRWSCKQQRKIVMPKSAGLEDFPHSSMVGSPGKESRAGLKPSVDYLTPAGKNAAAPSGVEKFRSAKPGHEEQ